MNIELLSLVISLLSVLAAAVAILFALKQSKESKKLLDLAKQQLDSANKIIESLSTKFIGQFPSYNSEIANLIEKAKESIDLLFDLPGYGLVSDPDSAIDIVKEIESKIKKNNKVSVSISIYSSNMRKKIINEQLKNEEFDKWKKSEDMESKLLQFLVNYGDGKTLDGLTKDQYIILSDSEHNRIISTNFKGANITPINELLPLYFWMIDKRHAIISIPSFAEGTTEYGFYTSDSALIEALLKMKSRYEK